MRELRFDGTGEARELRGAYVKDELLGRPADHLDRHDRAERVTEHDDLRTSEAAAKMPGKLDAVARESVQRQLRRRFAVTTERATRAALVPLHDSEIRLVRRELGRERRERPARPAVDMQQHGIAA